MEADLQAQVAFFLTGRRPSGHLDSVAGLALKPALFTGLTDLTRLRYDYPVVLSNSGDVFVHSLSGLVDGILAQLGKDGKGEDAERIRKHVLRLEQEIRTLVAAGAKGSLSRLWDKAAPPLASADALVAASLGQARAALKVDGEVLDCDAALPARLLAHAWNIRQAKKAEKFGKDVGRLLLKLSDILKADFVKSDVGRSAENLKASFGSGPMDEFDFQMMSRLLKKSTAKAAPPTLTKSRRKRVEALISVLGAQRFFPAGQDSVPSLQPFTFFFEGCGHALKAYRERLPKAIELVRAIAIADLEIKGEYNEAKHDLLFESFGENGLDAEDLARFPDYLVVVNEGKMPSSESDRLTEILFAGLPMKILVQTDDILGESPAGGGHLGLGSRSRQFASIAMGLNEVFVLQSSGSNLYRLRGQIARGLDYHGPALFSVFSGATGNGSGNSPYLTGAAAMESRAFPAYTYDPSAGPDWAARFSLADNTQADRDWPLQDFSFEDEEHQRISENIPFTLIDFVASDSRYARHFARVPQAKWNGTLVPVGEFVASDTRGLPERLPCLLMVGPDSTLQKVIVDDKLVREARRCRDIWHSLQELGGIHNSHAARLLERERKTWESSQIAVPAPAAADFPAVTAAVPAELPLAAELAPERSPDEAYIETARCSTCNECTLLNNKMFAYNENKQAYIADINAGTYAQLVEAAESCQVSVIHPGKPRNPDEPGLEELLKRAEPFL